MHQRKKDFYRRVDGILSSVLCNCLQLTIWFPTRQTYCAYKSTSNTADWMGHLVEHTKRASKPLREMVLPGTHDSASGTISPRKPFSAAGRTQSMSVSEQLNAGARYLDVRIAASSRGGKNLLSIWHGCLEGGNAENVLEEIRDFCNEHPNEVVILELVPEYGKSFDTAQKHAFLELTADILGNAVFPGSVDLRHIVEHKPFAELVRECSERIIVLLHDRFYENEFDMDPKAVQEQYGFVQSGKLMCNPWNNTRNVQEILDKNLQHVDTFSKYRSRFVTHQFLATPGVGGNATDVIGLLTGSNSLRPVSHACRLYESNVLDAHLRTHADKEWNVVSLDFLELCPDIVDYLISLNYSSSALLKIKCAVVHDIQTHTDRDVTEKVQALVSRSNTLLLIDPHKDLEIEEETHQDFDLTIAYSMNAVSGAVSPQQQHFVATIPIREDDCDDCPILLSPFCHSESMETVEVVNNNASSSSGGVVCQSKLFQTPSDVPNPTECTVLEYNNNNSNNDTGGDCNFTLYE